MAQQAPAALPRVTSVLAVGEGPDAPPCPFQAAAERFLQCSTPEEALRRVQATRPELVVVRETVPHAPAIAFVQQARQTAPESPVVVLSAAPDVDEAIRFIRHGARDYLPTPVDEAVLARALLAARCNQPAEEPHRFFAPECPPGVPIAGQSDGIRACLQTIRQVAENRCNPAVIVGETGTGKELAARAVHALCGGEKADFIAVNCATLSANLLESELFGHVKGAFTGADHDKQGLFEIAGNGSLFLDEISEMDPALQAKLLRVLQEREFRRVGGHEAVPCRATIIASSNRDLVTETEEGRFRRDLYYRLAVFPIRLPPLRAPERRDDVLLLADYFLRTSVLPAAERVRGLTPAARDKLHAHTWPGNVRELKNVVDRALMTVTGDTITADDLLMDTRQAPPAPTRTSVPVPENDFSLETAERLFITRALKETGWQRTRAAALLGITRATLHAKLKRYAIKVPDRASGTRASRLQEAGA